MSPKFQLSGARIAATIAAALIEILLPLALALIAWRRLGVGWRYFGFGALIFLLFQLLTRVPIVQIVQSRYVGYRWLMRREEKTWPKAIMYGLGHGGLESMLLVGGLVLLGLINMLALSAVDLNTLPISAEQRAQLAAQLAAVSAQPAWLPLVGAWERLWSIAFHVAMSVVVLQVFRRGSLRWLWLAIAAHALVDFVAAGIPALAGLKGTAAIVAPELFITLTGLAGLWAIWALRDRPEDAGASPSDPEEI